MGLWIFSFICFQPSQARGPYLPLPRRLSVQGLWARLSRDMEHELNPHKGLSPPPTQYLKAIGLWVFLVIYWWTFSFLLKMEPTLMLNIRQSKVPLEDQIIW